MSNVIGVINDLPKDADLQTCTKIWHGFLIAWVLLKVCRENERDLIISCQTFLAIKIWHKYTFSHYQKRIFVKVLFLHEFLKTDYDKFALLDLDMVVSKTAPDIFEYHKDDEFMMQYGFNEAVVKRMAYF